MVGVVDHVEGQGAREKLVESGGTLLEVGAQVPKELVVDAGARHILMSAVQSVVKEVHEVVLERGGLELDGEKVQPDQILAAYLVEKLLEVNNIGEGAVAVESSVDPLDEEAGRVGVLVGEVHEAQDGLERVLWCRERRQLDERARSSQSGWGEATYLVKTDE